MDERKSQVTSGEEKKRKHGAIILLALIILFIFFAVVMVINSRKPSYHVMATENVDKGIRGAHFVRVNQVLIKEMANNWLPNDLFWPTALLDNMPNFQLGELEVARYNVRVLRDNLSRMRTTDKLDHQAMTEKSRRYVAMMMRKAGVPPTGQSNTGGIVVVKIPARPFFRPVFEKLSKGAPERVMKRVVRLLTGTTGGA